MNTATIKRFAMLTAGVLLTIYIARQVPMVGPYVDKAISG